MAGAVAMVAFDRLDIDGAKLPHLRDARRHVDVIRVRVDIGEAEAADVLLELMLALFIPVNDVTPPRNLPSLDVEHVASPRACRDGPVRAFVVSQQRDLLQAIARTARICIEEGHFRRDLDIDQLAFEVLAMYLAFHHSHRLLRDPRAEQQLRRAYTRLVEDAAARQ